MVEQQFKNLFSPGRIGNMELRNRIVLAAHTTGYWSVDEGPGERARDYYVARVKGGAAMIVVPQNLPLPPTSENAKISLRDDGTIPAYQALSEEIHEHGGKIIGQLDHPGVRGSVAFYGGVALSASPTPFPIEQLPPQFATDVPYEMEIDEIGQVVKGYAEAALRLKESGYDGVEISTTVGSGGLLLSFLSPYYNKRSDAYGGSLENRMRLINEILDAVRIKTGSDFVVGIRLVSDELIDGGITLDDARVIAPRLEATGHVDYLSISAGVVGHVPSMYFPLGCFVHLAAGIKEVVNLPVICHGRVNDPVQAEQIISGNQADFVGMVRALICDPEWPNKSRDGKLDEIRKCIACNQVCIGNEVKDLPISCSLNPEAGREKAMTIIPARESKKVLIVGGGAAGLEAARVAALRGHNVILFERDDELGGQANIAARIPGRLDFSEVSRYYGHQMDLLGIKVVLGTEATVEMIRDENPDAVIIATGSTATFLNVAGGDSDIVVSVRDMLQEKVPVGDNVVVFTDEHHSQALGAADFIAQKGKRVQILCEALYPGGHMDPITFPVAYSRLHKKGVVITPMTSLKEIRSNSVVTVNTLSGEEDIIEGVDTVVYASSGDADNALYRELKDEVKEIYRIGQCLSPRQIQHSIWDGARVGRQI